MSVEYPEGGTRAPHSSFRSLFYLVFLEDNEQTDWKVTDRPALPIPAKMQRRKLEEDSSLFNFLFCLASPVLLPHHLSLLPWALTLGGAWLSISRCGKPLLTPRPFDWHAGHTGKALASLEQQRHLKAGAQLGSQISRPSSKHSGQERMG